MSETREGTETADKVYENKLRRQAARQDLNLIKSKTRDPRATDHGGWMVVNAKTGRIEAGDHFSLTAAEVDRFLMSRTISRKPSFVELEKLGKVRVAPVGPHRIVAFTLNDAYLYDLHEDAGNGLTVKDYAVSLMEGGRWGDTAREWAAGDFETWSAHVRAQRRYRNLQITLEQATEDKVDAAYLESLSRRIEKAWYDLQETNKPIRKGLDEAKARVEAAKIRAELSDQQVRSPIYPFRQPVE